MEGNLLEKAQAPFFRVVFVTVDDQQTTRVHYGLLVIN